MWSLRLMLFIKLVCLFALAVTLSVTAKGTGKGTSKGVSYDARSFFINGKREIIFSGSIHYPRSTPEMWPDLIARSKAGGLNCIQTYTFWNGHEPVQGQYNFEGRFDIVKFIKLVAEQGLYVTLRIGPFIQAEWNHGGLPFWLREIQNVTFRTDNEPFKFYMKKYTEMIVSLMKKENLYASQGGPIILTQIENEYDTIQRAFGESGSSYVKWAGNMALKMNTGVPWVMCKQKDAPGEVINACNGRNCADTFVGPNAPTKPFIWTENWTQQFQIFGDGPSLRSSEDIAYSVARFFSKNGTLVNYYMYHGGTNFGRTAASFVTPRYYDDAPLDEFGLPKDPKYSHLTDLHQALKLCTKALLWGTSSNFSMGNALEAVVYEQPGSTCAAFLTNKDKRVEAAATFRGSKYYLPPRSISILPDCKTLVYNTHQVVAQHNLRRFKPAEKSNKNLEWQMYQEKVPSMKDATSTNESPMEHMGLAKDTTDYVWYLTTLELDDEDLPWRTDISPVLECFSLGHGLLAFVNGAYLGYKHGDKAKQSCHFRAQAPLKAGKNHIAVLSWTIGLMDSGVYLEKRFSGLRFVTVKGLNTGTLDVSNNGYGFKVGLEGEKLRIFSEEGVKKVKWSSAMGTQPITWYKTYFDAPDGDGPTAIELRGMSKGQIWVNGESIGRYWMSFLSPQHKPTQTFYHIPRSFLKPKGNLLVIFEEFGGKPEKIRLMTVNRDTVCSYVTEYHPPPVDSWTVRDGSIQAVSGEAKPLAQLNCPDDKVITTVEFASFGNPEGVCGGYTLGKCNYPESKSIIERFCLGKKKCQIPIQEEIFGGDNCKGIGKGLAVQLQCG